MFEFNSKCIDTSWQALLSESCSKLDHNYLNYLKTHQNWLPGPNNLFNAFSLPLPKVKTILIGESPYPRACSANGYAFWDAAVDELWSEKGLSKAVNRATSLRNFIKMLLVADSQLTPNDVSQQAIAKLDKSCFITSIDKLFNNMMRSGILLLNASLVLSKYGVRYDAKQWQPFLETLLNQMSNQQSKVKLLLFGKVAELVTGFKASKYFELYIAEHPYNISFITNRKVLDFFQPLHILSK